MNEHEIRDQLTRFIASGDPIIGISQEQKDWLMKFLIKISEFSENKGYLDGYSFAREEMRVAYECYPDCSAKELLELIK